MKQGTRRIFYLLSVAIVVAVVAFGYYYETRDKRVFIECEGTDFVHGHIFAFDKDYFYHNYRMDDPSFRLKKFVNEFDNVKASYKGIINEKYNEYNVEIDRVNGTIIFFKNKFIDPTVDKKRNCKKIEKIKVMKIPAKF